jgi:hypothetical protein
MTLNWLFVVQNFEVKSYEDSAAKIEVIEPIKKSTFVKNQQVLCFDRSYTEHYADIVQSNLNKLLIEIGQEPVVIYGAGLHLILLLLQIEMRTYGESNYQKLILSLQIKSLIVQSMSLFQVKLMKSLFIRI